MEGTKSVAIVGAGAAGLIFAEVLLRNGFDITLYEQNSEVGGVWNYCPRSSVMYGSLRINLPKDIMAFNPENVFSDTLESFVSHREVQSYLVKFCEQNNIRQFIRFNSLVKAVGRYNATKCDSRKWTVTSINKISTEERSGTFDVVVVCSGHFSVPFIPPTPPGFHEHFQGTAIHSAQYDTIKDSLAGKRVLVVGSNSSGTDMARELMQTAEKVFVSARSYRPQKDTVTSLTEPSELNKELPALLPAIERVDSGGSIVFVDGTAVSDIDVVLWCTGYLYDFPFLREEATHTRERGESNTSSGNILVQVEAGKRVRPLYQQLFHVEDPTLVFAGLPFRVVPFPLFYYQGELKHISGSSLPFGEAACRALLGSCRESSTTLANRCPHPPLPSLSLIEQPSTQWRY